MSWQFSKFSGIAPDSKHAAEQSESLEQERKLVREALISAYDKTIAIKLKADLCSMEANNYNITRDASASKPSISKPFSLSKNWKILITQFLVETTKTFTFNFILGLKFLYHWVDAGYDMQSEKWCTSWWHQFKVLLQRGLRERRFEAFNRLRIFQVISVAFLGGLLWWHTPESHIEDRVRVALNLSCLRPKVVVIYSGPLNKFHFIFMSTSERFKAFAQCFINYSSKENSDNFERCLKLIAN